MPLLVFFGIITAHFIELPAGSTIIILHAILFLVLYTITKVKGRV